MDDNSVNVAIKAPNIIVGVFRPKLNNSQMMQQVTKHEIDPDKVKLTHGMDITFVTSAKEDNEAKELLILLGMPFSKEN